MTAERQQLPLALGLAAGLNVLLCLAIVWAMAVFRSLGGPSLLTTAVAAEETVLEITLSPSPDNPPAPDQKQIIDSSNNQSAPAPPDTSRFLSSVDQLAASETAPSPDGPANMPSQAGIDKPYLDLRDSTFRDGNPNETPLPAAPAPPAQTTDAANLPPSSNPPETTSPAPPSQPAPAAFRDPEAPNLTPLDTPLRPAQSPPPLTRIPDRLPDTFRPGRTKSKTLGTITNKGPASVDAKASAEGRYETAIRASVEKNWRRRLLKLTSFANPGLVEIDFEIDTKGRISNVKLTNPGEANPVMQDCALSAIIDAKLPPPPTELFNDLDDSVTGGRLRRSFSFLLY